MSERTVPIVSGYQLLKRVHRNARLESEVWHATDAAGDEVALKLTPRDGDPEAQVVRNARFNDEASAGQVLHEHVRRLVRFGSVSAASEGFPDGFDWLAFSWVDGESLAEYLDKRRATSDIGLRAHELRDIARALVNALSALHRASPPWIHRDVKPANVLLPGGDLRLALLADLGIAWREGGVRQTALSGMGASGTLLYMAPEQFSLDDLTPAVDQYALALTLWECATGSVPYTPSMRSSDIRHARTKQEPLSDLMLARSGPARTLRAVFQRALSASPAERFPNMVDFWHEFHSAGVHDRLWDEDISFQKPSGTKPSAERSKALQVTEIESRFECRGVWLEQGEHLASYVGREVEHSRILSWIRSADTAGYLVIVGPPGQGKSAIMARLAEMEGTGRGEPRLLEDRVALLHMVKSHRDPTRLLQSLIAQADRLLGRLAGDQQYGANSDDLRELLLHRLADLVKAGRCVTVFIDALDEIADDGGGFNWLPSVLPNGAKCVLSCRDDPRIMLELTNRLASLEHEPLAPFSQNDVVAYLEFKFAQAKATLDNVVDVSELHERTGGTPLVLRDVIRRLASRIDGELLAEKPKRISLKDVSGSTVAVFQNAYYEIVKTRLYEVDGAESASLRGKTCENILHILACTLSPLSARSLRSLVKVEDVKLSSDSLARALRSMRPYLTEQDDRFALWHRGFTEYIADQVLGSDGVAQTHRRFIEWIAAGRASQEYLLANYAAHLHAHCLAVSNDDGDCYEREWRAIHKDADTEYCYGVEALTGVYLGAGLSPAETDLVAHVVHGTPVQLYQMSRSHTSFRLETRTASYELYRHASSNGHPG